MPIVNRFESGRDFRSNIAKATGRPAGMSKKPSEAKVLRAPQQKSKAPVTLPAINIGKRR